MAIGETCLSSPTISTFLPRRIAGSAVMSDWDASSMITKLKTASSAGSCSETRHSGKIQQGTADAVSIVDSRTIRLCRPAAFPVPLPRRPMAAVNLASAASTRSVRFCLRPINVRSRTTSANSFFCSASAARRCSDSPAIRSRSLKERINPRARAHYHVSRQAPGTAGRDSPTSLRRQWAHLAHPTTR
jgi:hypothetical protein